MGYTNSPLVDCMVLSPNHSGQRTHSIDRITPHCVCGQLSAESIGRCFPKGRGASCNYGIGYDGRVSLIVEEKNRSWCSSDYNNDQRAITIEVASDRTSPYAFTNQAYNKLVDLCVDICRRNGKKKLLWFNDKRRSLVYKPATYEMVLTVHRWFANKACPGDWLYNRLGKLAEEVTRRLSKIKDKDKPKDKAPKDKKLYKVLYGSFTSNRIAKEHLDRMGFKDIGGFIVPVDNLWAIQVGVHSNRESAENQRQKLTANGFECYIVEVLKEKESFTPRKTPEEIAEEIWTGKCSDKRWNTWGTAATRTARLKAAGYNPKKVQDAIKRLYG